MMRPSRLLVCAAVLWLAPVLVGQVTLNPSPATVLGHPQLTLRTANPNLVEGRELYSPSAVAIDTSATPPILYVADTGNNRVLAWRNASQFSNGAFADLVIGQKDLFSTFPQGPGYELTGGLSAPTGVAVDAIGDLFVADAGNNRVLRYSRPFADPQQVKLPDLVIGQASLGTRAANSDPDTHTISARTLRLNNGSAFYLVSLILDTAGNLFVADAGNNRVLRYKAADVGSSATNGPAADLLLGQSTFTSTPQNPSSTTDLTRLATPAGMAMDSAGRLYVCDGANRVLVYLAPLANGAAYRMMGGVPNTLGLLQPPDARTLYAPNGVFFVGDRPYVVDTGNNRILRFPKYSDWPVDISTPPTADDVIGQANFTDYKANRGAAQPAVSQPAVSLSSPTLAVPSAGDLFVADDFNHRVVVLSDPATTAGANTATKRVLGQVYLDGNSANYVEGREFSFGGAGGVVVDTHSSPPHLYVADTFNNRILGFRDARIARPGDKADLVIGQPDFYRSVANYPSNLATQPTSKSLYNPVGVAVDSSGNLYVADTGNGRVLRFPAPFDHGNYPGADLVLGKPDVTTSRDSTPDPTYSTMFSPVGLAFTAAGHLLVSDSVFHRVLLFRKPVGDFNTFMAASGVIGQTSFYDRVSGSGTNRMNTPTGIGVDTSDRLFVCDTGNNRVLAYDSIGSAPSNPSPAFLLTDVDKYGGKLNAPQGIYVSPVTGETWVADTGARYILRYPKFETLVLSPLPDFVITTSTTVDERALALTVDGFGNLLSALSTNRIGFYFAASTPRNTANLLSGLAPGMMVSLYTMSASERVFAAQTVSAASLPLPTELADIQVLVNDQPAPLLMVSPSQINFLMPMSTPTGTTIQLQAVRKSLNQILAVGCAATQISSNPDRYACSGLLQTNVASPALFAGSTKYEGTGQIVAYNVKASDGSSYGVNSTSNPVARSDYIVLYGTGQGFIPNVPADGAAPGGVYWTPGSKPQVIVNAAFVGDDNVSFSGLSPEYPGLWQLNVKIPDTTPPSTSTGGATLLVVVHKGIASNGTTQQEKSRIVTTIQVKQ